MVMRALDRKLLRDLSRLKLQAAAIALVVASGVGMFIAMVATYRSIRISEQHYYADQRFGHIWADLSRAPSSVTRTIAAVSGVAAVEGRIKERVILDVPGLVEPASAELVSIPSEPDHAVNGLHVRRGRHVERGNAGEVLVSEAFAEANHLALGDRMTATVAGQRVELRFVGVALSPEYVMPTMPNGLSADDHRYAILWMAHDELQSLVDLRGAINEVAVRLMRGADERAVIAAIDRILEPYGGRGAFARDSLPSQSHYEEHVQMITSLAVVMPTIFLLVAAFLVNMVLSRMVATQREQIGLLKAFGYTSGRVATHYLELALLIVLGGVVLGLPLGVYLGRLIAEFFGKFFRFPVLVFRVDPPVALGAALVAVASAALGALGTVRRVVSLPPIVAMAPEVPRFHRSLFDRIGLSKLLAPSSRMILRGVTRRPLRSALAIAGMSLAVAVAMLGMSVKNFGDRMRDVRYQAVERQDLTVSLIHPRAVGTVQDFLHLPGVRRAEPFRVAPARILAHGRTQDIALFGLPAGGVLHNVVDGAYRTAFVPRDGAIVTTWLAKHFGLRRGDLLTLEIRENRRRVVTVPIVELLDEGLGVAVYMDLDALGRLLGEPGTYSGANLTVDPTRERDLYAVLKRTPAAVAVDFRSGALAMYRAMGDAAVEFIRQIEVVFGIIIAFGVVYNTARIALAEHARELATLRVLGFTRGEVSRILLGEIAALAIPAVPLGFAMGYGLSALIVSTMNGERMHPALVIDPSTYGLAFVVFIVAAAASALVVRRGLDRLDLLAVLKARE